MPMKTRQLELLPETSPSAIPAELLDQVVKGPMTQQSLEAVMKSFRKAVIERALNAEMSPHLGYAPGEDKPADMANHRNGTSGKTEVAREIRIP